MSLNDANVRVVRPLAGASMVGCLVVAGWLAAPPLAAETCNSMWQLKEHILTGRPCAAIADPHDSPPRPAPGVGLPDGKLFAKYLPKCQDGTNVCAPADEVRCVDGTRSLIHVDKAVDAAGIDIESDQWVFYVQGGGACTDPQECWNTYPFKLSEMSTERAPLWLGPGGILRSDPSSAFSGYNRVRLYKCTYDWFAGNASYVGEPVNGGADVVNVALHGRRLWSGTFATLAAAPGITFEDESCLEGVECNSLPPLSDATRILLVAWSAGARGLIHQVDALTAELAALAPNADVRTVLDGRFPAMLDVEAVVTGRAVSIYDQNRDPGDLPAVAWDGTTDDRFSVDKYCADPAIAEPACTLGVQGVWNQMHRGFALDLDASCLAAHPESTDPAPCNDAYHVLANHVTTPFFIRMGLRDTAYLDLNSDPMSGDDLLATAEFWHGGVPDQKGDKASWYRWEEDDFRDRVRVQALDVAYLLRTDSELATGADPSFLGGFPAGWSFGLYLPDATKHDGVTDTVQFTTDLLKLCRDGDGDGVYESLVGSRSTETAIELWLDGPQGFDLPHVAGDRFGEYAVLPWDDFSEPCS